MSNVVICCENLSKQYRIGARQEPYRTLRDSLANAAMAPIRMFARTRKDANGKAPDTIWALKDVSFEVKRGEVVGIIGRNGAGKSTLLSILSRITEPTAGRARLKGRIAALLEVGTGFNPELTGRENIYLNAAILGMKKVEIDRKFDEIVAFAEVEKFIDTPVKHYSSGMHLRLGFAVAAHLEPDILVVDEVLAVGDASFQKKCLGKMGDVAKGGRTVLFVSHNMAAIQTLCGKSIFLAGGKIETYGATAGVCQIYLRHVTGEIQSDLASRKDRQGTQSVVFMSFQTLDETRRPVKAFLSGQSAVLRFELENRYGRPLKNVEFALGIDSSQGFRIAHLSTDVSGTPLQISEGTQAIEVVVDKLPLMPGLYMFALFATANGEIADWVQNAGSFSVEAGDYFGSGRLAPQGVFIINHRVVVSGV